ncbi:MAG: hypothetical protein JWO03_1977 [Bacteroidetes bacterium]|nr:hypothetical protein [Bacteroidota bacterium]
MNEIMTQQQIDLRARYFYLSCVVIFVVYFLSNTLFSQLAQPVLIDPGIDNTYWLFHWFGIPHAVTHSTLWSAVLDIFLFLLPVAASIVTRRRIYAILFTILILVYQITLSTYSTHHFHTLVGVLFLSIPFWFGPGQRFTFTWEAVRYYFFFMFSSAALWKICRGSAFDPHQMSNILMAQHAQYIYDYPDSIFTRLYSYLISHYQVSFALLIMMVLIQLSFLGGFFTKKYDRIYLYIFIAFTLLNYLVMHISSAPLLIFCLVLLNWEKIEKKALKTS